LSSINLRLKKFSARRKIFKRLKKFFSAEGGND